MYIAIIYLKIIYTKLMRSTHWNLVHRSSQLLTRLGPNSVVLNLDSNEPQGFSESVTGVWRREILSIKSKKKIHDTHFIFPSTKGSMNACIELVGFSTSNKVRNHCPN